MTNQSIPQSPASLPVQPEAASHPFLLFVDSLVCDVLRRHDVPHEDEPTGPALAA